MDIDDLVASLNDFLTDEEMIALIELIEKNPQELALKLRVISDQ